MLLCTMSFWLTTVCLVPEARPEPEFPRADLLNIWAQPQKRSSGAHFSKLSLHFAPSSSTNPDRLTLQDSADVLRFAVAHCSFEATAFAIDRIRLLHHSDSPVWLNNVQ